MIILMIMMMITFGDVREASGTLMMTAVRRSAPRPTHAAREREAVRMTLDVRTITSSSAAPRTVTQRYGDSLMILMMGLTRLSGSGHYPF